MGVLYSRDILLVWMEGRWEDSLGVGGESKWEMDEIHIAGYQDTPPEIEECCIPNLVPWT